MASRRQNSPHHHRSRKGTRVSSAKHSDAPGPDIRLTRRDKAAGEWFAKLAALQARLRAPGGCPWDREQTHESLRKFLIEETYEVLDAMQAADPRKFASELGDLLLQVVFHSILAEESGRFNISDVIESVYTKMVRRHPHVFGEAKAKTAADVLKNWEQLKAAERAEEEGMSGSAAPKDAAPESILAGVPRSLPGVLEAYQLTRRASHVGFDWDNLASLFDKLDEEKQELKSAPDEHHSREEEVGDLLFVAVNVARFLDVDPEIALKKANAKFKRRFEWMESAAANEGLRFADLPRARMEELWEAAKVKA